MDSQPNETVPAAAAAGEGPPLSVWQRAVAIFTRPGSAWSGLETRVQWWFPMLLIMLVNTSFSAALWNRAILPTQLDAMEEKVASGEMPAESMERAETMMRSPAGLAFAVVPWVVISPIINMIAALVVMFAVGFLLGGKLGFRKSLEVATWSGLVQIPGTLLTGILAWSKETMEGVHVSLAALLPEPEKTNKVMKIVMGILDGLGPFGIWLVVVMVIGASTLSGVPRKRVAWALGGMYLALVIFFSSLGAMFSR